MKKLLLLAIGLITSTALAGLNISPAGTANGVPITPTTVGATSAVTTGTYFGTSGASALMGFTTNSTISMGSNGPLTFSANSNAAAAQDAGIGRISAGLLEVNTATLGAWADLKVRKHFVDQTVTAGGTTGAQTINKAAGTVNFAAAATSLIVTNSQVTTSSTIFCTVRTADSTALLKNVVPASGSFTINLNAAATAETSVGFLVVN